MPALEIERPAESEARVERRRRGRDDLLEGGDPAGDVARLEQLLRLLRAARSAAPGCARAGAAASEQARRSTNATDDLRDLIGNPRLFRRNFSTNMTHV